MKRCRTTLAVSLAMVSGSATAQQMYTVTDLGTLGGTASGAWSLNERGAVVGQAALADSESLRATVWDGVLTDLGADVFPQSVAFAINDADVIVGTVFALGETSGQAAQWDSGVLTVLGDFMPRGINNAGTVVGVRTLNLGGFFVERAVRYEGGLLTELGGLSGGFSAAHAVSAAGRIVGTASGVDGAARATLWDGGSGRDLGTLGGAWGQALAVNDANWIVGVSATAGGIPRACLYVVDGAGTVLERRDLGALGASGSHAYGVNNNGQVVGTSDWRAFVWQNDQMMDLNERIGDPTWELTHATDINDAGQIVGRGRHGGQWRAFLLTPDDCPGDVDANGRVDLSDLAVVLGNFGLAPATRGDGDLDGDGDVDLNDLSAVLAVFGQACG